MQKIINDKNLWNHIQGFIPISDITRRNRRKVISEFKYKYGEWSSHKRYCYCCQGYHPLGNISHKICVVCFKIYMEGLNAIDELTLSQNFRYFNEIIF